MKKCCESLREHAMKTINFKKNKMKLFTKEQQESYENAKICYRSKEKFENKYVKDKIFCKLRNHCRYTGEDSCAVYSICNVKCSVPTKTPISFHSDSNYHYHFIIKELVEKLSKNNLLV